MKIIEIIQSLSSKFVLYFCISILTIIFLINVGGIFLFSSFLENISLPVIMFILVTVLLIIAVGIALYKSKSEKVFIISLFLVGLFIRVIWISLIKTEPVSDFSIMYEAAKSIKEGNYAEVFSSNYFSMWAYQLGFTLSMSFIMRLTSGGLFELKLINSILISIIPLVIYFSGKKLGNKKFARVMAIIYCLYVPSIVSSSVLTNQHLASLLFYGGLYLVIANMDKRYSWILIGILFGVGNIIRPEGSVVIIALGLFWIFKNIVSVKKLALGISRFIGVVIIIWGLNQVVSSFLINEGISQYKLSNRDPLWKVTCGLNPESNGTYNDEDLVRLSQFEDRTEGHLTIIKERLSNVKQLINTLIHKVVIMWGSDDTSIGFAFTENMGDYNELYNILIKLEKIQYIVIISLALFGCINIVKSNKGFINNHIFAIILIGYFLAHLIVEIQPRYRYFIVPSLCILGTYVKFDYENKRRTI